LPQASFGAGEKHLTDKEENKRFKALPTVTAARVAGTGGTMTASTYTTSVSGGTSLTGGYSTFIYPSGFQYGEPQYPSTAQPQRLVDYHARADIEEIKQVIGQFESRFAHLEEGVGTVISRLDRIEGLPTESISANLANLLRNIPSIRGGYFWPTTDGYEILLTYPDLMPLVEFLEAVVPAEIEIDRRYKNIYFDFQHLPESEFSLESFPNAKPIR
jgi:hypothetical protein